MRKQANVASRESSKMIRQETTFEKEQVESAGG